MERATLSEVREKYLSYSHPGLSLWQQGGKACAVPSATLHVLATHQSEPRPLWLDKTSARLQIKLHAFQRSLSQLGKLSDKVIETRTHLEALSDVEFAQTIINLQKRSKFEREAYSSRIRSVDIQAMAGICEAVRRVFGFKPHREQIMGAFAILKGAVAEMATGEGKTLTANLSAITAAWRGMPVHVVTANDYLAARDCELGQKLFAKCGVTAAFVTGDVPPDRRSAAYGHDIVYTTARDMLADHLRDDLVLAGKVGRIKHALAPALNAGKVKASGIVMRGAYQVIVDEADSVLIDEAVTPLIISEQKPDDLLASAAVKAVDLARNLEISIDYLVNTELRSVELTPAGRINVARMVLDAGPFWQRRDRAEELVNTALYSMHMMALNKHYLIEEGKVVLIDELTGRLARERTLSLGVQQVLEAALDLDISDPSSVRARLSFQRYFQRLPRIGGMTGTAHESKTELGKVYGLGIVQVPTHQPSKRKAIGYQIFGYDEEKLSQIVKDTKLLSHQGRAILIGVKSVLTSQNLATIFTAEAPDLPFKILNAVNDTEENTIIARAGQSGMVTIATNMAGRGTDIKIPKDVVKCGGLHVIIAETNDFSRIDRQLIGRCARQGDPGSYERYVALDEDVVTRFLPTIVRRIWAVSFRIKFATQTVACLMLFLAQRRAEHLAYKHRKSALENEIETEKNMI